LPLTVQPVLTEKLPWHVPWESASWAPAKENADGGWGQEPDTHEEANVSTETAQAPVSHSGVNDQLTWYWVPRTALGAVPRMTTENVPVSWALAALEAPAGPDGRASSTRAAEPAVIGGRSFRRALPSLASRKA
jgi:hypothetical protein